LRASVLLICKSPLAGYSKPNSNQERWQSG
jgi:hypothetical protein